MSLTNESVVALTGAGSGIGRALAKRLAAEGVAGLALADIDEAGLAETAASISGVEVSTHVVDVADEARMEAFADEVVARHGRVTHLINNAGVALGGRVEDVSTDDIRWLMGVNFWGVVYGTKYFLPHLQKERSAHIVNFSSLFGLIAPPGQATYCASKFAVRGWTEALRHELAGTNVNVSVVHPGGVATNIATRARLGAFVKLSEEEIKERVDLFNEQLARTSPEKAADIVVRGIRSRNPRIIVGFDSRILSIVQRIFPKSYFKVAFLLSGGKLREY